MATFFRFGPTAAGTVIISGARQLRGQVATNGGAVVAELAHEALGHGAQGISCPVNNHAWTKTGIGHGKIFTSVGEIDAVMADHAAGIEMFGVFRGVGVGGGFGGPHFF